MVRSRGVTPVNQVHIEPFIEEVLDKTPPRFQIQHDVPVDEGINHQNRGAVHILSVYSAFIMKQPHLIFPVHNSCRCGCHPVIQITGEHFGGPQEFLGEIL